MSPVASIASGITVSAVDRGRWNDLVQQFPGRTVFHLLPWLETVSAVHGARIVLARADCDGDCVAVWPYLELRKGPLRIIGSPLPGWSTAYMGPLFRECADIDSVLQAILQHSLFRRYAYMSCKMITRTTQPDLSRLGFTVRTEFDTYIIDLSQPEETLWHTLKSECRTRIRKARALGIEIREERDGGFVSDFWRMSLDTFAKSGIQPTYSPRFVQELWRRLRPANLVRALSAYLQGQRIATLVLPYDDRSMYYWGGAASAEFRHIPANNLLHWEAVRMGRSMGLEEYDMISTLGGPGRFKSTFGPQIVPMATHWERSSSRLLAALKQRYESYLNRRRRLQA